MPIPRQLIAEGLHPVRAQQCWQGFTSRWPDIRRPSRAMGRCRGSSFYARRSRSAPSGFERSHAGFLPTDVKRFASLARNPSCAGAPVPVGREPEGSARSNVPPGFERSHAGLVSQCPKPFTRNDTNRAGARPAQAGEAASQGTEPTGSARAPAAFDVVVDHSG